jgi:hypothetical protein
VSRRFVGRGIVFEYVIDKPDDLVTCSMPYICSPSPWPASFSLVRNHVFGH